MFQTKERFLQSWDYEAAQTQKVLNNLTDDSLKQQITPDNWELGRLAWHTVSAIKIISSQSDLTFEAPAKDFPVPSSASYIAESYQQASAAFVEAIKTQWMDESLNDVIDFYGQMKMTKGTLLLFLLQHQTHHRGQMTVLMRQAGLNVPGLYGPSKEEWALMGMEAPQM
ncbi:DinB family protein [Metabacillus sp. Hm71]|uniref:DinB family protein n=1 Tax=Metabacillus sp. Hm71 TaxID=3450743 RepID=UPI003F42B20D